MGSIPALVVRMTKPIWGSGRVILLDSGFGYLPSLTRLHEKGLFATCVIKKKQHWPKGTDGNALLQVMQGREVGTQCVRKGTHHDWPDCQVWIGMMADSKHVSIMANTWSTTCPAGTPRKRCVSGSLVEVTYGEYMHWYYYGRHAVDDNNNNRQGHLPFEEAYCARRWDLRQFGFIIALAQVNSMLAFNYFVRRETKDFVRKAAFLRMLARDLIFNPESASNWKTRGGTTIKTNARPKLLPPGCKIASSTSKIARGGHELVRLEKFSGKWNGHTFPKIQTDYSKCACSMRCGTLTRTFCYCDFSLMLCAQCYGEHIAAINVNI